MESRAIRWQRPRLYVMTTFCKPRKMFERENIATVLTSSVSESVVRVLERHDKRCNRQLFTGSQLFEADEAC